MHVLIAGAHGRLGSRLVALALHRGHRVRALVRRQGQADALAGAGAEPVLADLRGDVEWAADGCDAAIFAAGARHLADVPAVEGGGAAKLAEAADRFDLGRFVLCSAVGAGQPERRAGALRDYLRAKRHAERRLASLEVPWTIFRMGRLTEQPGRGRIGTHVPPGRSVTLNRDDAALTIVESLAREHLGRQVVDLVDGDREVAAALDAIEPLPLPGVAEPGGVARRGVPLGEAQSSNPPDAADMIVAGAPALDSDVDFEGDGPLPPELAGNDDPSPGVP